MMLLTDPHSRPADECVTAWDSVPDGLSGDEAVCVLVSTAGPACGGARAGAVQALREHSARKFSGHDL